MPAGAFVPLGDGVWVASPAFCLVQLAARLPLLAVVRLASELCGVAVPVLSEETGFGACRPLSTLDDLVWFAA